MVTLSHGNEPSGLEALHRWLRSGRTPQVNIVVILGGIKAALASPIFFFRHMPSDRDLNRCFSPPYSDSQGNIAYDIIKHIRELSPEAIIDVHNTSGSSGPFAVSYETTSEKTALAGLFVDHLVVSELKMGSIMEQDFGAPIITVEAGGAKDHLSSSVADSVVEKYFLGENVLEYRNPNLIIYEKPFRLEITPDSRLDFSGEPLMDRDITIREDIDKFSFKAIHNEYIGWLNRDDIHHLTVKSYLGDHSVADFFQVKEGTLYPSRPIRIFMATTPQGYCRLRLFIIFYSLLAPCSRHPLLF